MGENREVGTMRIKIADMIYVLDIQNKNKHINQILDKYGMDRSSMDRVKIALQTGRWKVVG
jgi:hypothetical protein